MAKSAAATVDAYLRELPQEKREVVSTVLDFVRRHIPKGYEESMSWGMIGWEVPLEKFSDTYNGKPLGYAALAAQKNHYALYLMCAYADGGQEKALRDGFRAAGKKLDMGKSCIRFRSVDDLALEPLGEAIASTTPDEFVEQYRKARSGAKR